MRVLSVASSYSDQPEEQIITISRIKDASCPYRYFKGYVEKPKASKPFESIEAGLGQFFHSYVESHFKRIMARDSIISKRDILDVSNLLAEFSMSFVWEGRLRPPYKIVRSTYSLQDFIRRLQGVAENFNRFLLTRMVGHRVLAIEGNLQIRTESFYIRGKHDLVTQEPSGPIVLWDWKTGSAPKPEYYEEFRNQKIQLGVYAVWINYKYRTPNVRGTAVFLRDGCVDLSETFTTAIEQEVLNYADAWRRQLNTQTSYPPILNNLCNWCGWNPVCPAYQRQWAPVQPPTAASSPRYSRPQSAQPTRTSCFIVSCVFENVETPEVGLFRSFRDEYLLRKSGGRAAIDVYEKIGPTIAAIIGRQRLSRKIVKEVLRVFVAPLIKWCMESRAGVPRGS
jgi:hypothetical protein